MPQRASRPSMLARQLATTEITFGELAGLPRHTLCDNTTPTESVLMSSQLKACETAMSGNTPRELIRLIQHFNKPSACRSWARMNVRTTRSPLGKMRFIWA